MALQEYAIEFLFDEQTEKQLFAFYEQLERAGFGLPEHVVNYHPHLTLNVCTAHDLEQLELVLADFTKTCSVFPVTLSHLGCFLPPHPVVFLAPTIPQKLFDIHTDFLAQAKPFISEARAYYEPNLWVPHCTLAFGFEPNKLADVMAICVNFTLPIQAQLSSIALIAVPEGKRIYHFPLSCS